MAKSVTGYREALGALPLLVTKMDQLVLGRNKYRPLGCLVRPLATRWSSSRGKLGWIWRGSLVM